MEIKFDPKEIERLKGILKFHPEGNAAISTISDLMVLQDLTNKLKYPINCHSDLVKQLGEGKTIRMGNVEMGLDETKHMIPAYYFPITCEEDFFDKCAELMKAGMEPPEMEPAYAGEEVSAEMAPPIPTELKELKIPPEMPPGGSFGLKKEEVIARLQKQKEV